LLLVDVAIPNELSVKITETKKLSKYQDLEIEVSRMWKVRIKIVPVIIGALVTIKKGLDQSLLLCPGHPLATELQKVTLINTSFVQCWGKSLLTLVEIWT